MLLKLKVHAGSKETKIHKRAADSYEIWVRAPAERGLANAAALTLMAKELAVPSQKLRIIKGAHMPAKIVYLLD